MPVPLETTLTPGLRRWVDDTVRRQVEARFHEVLERTAEELTTRLQKASGIAAYPSPVTGRETSRADEVREPTATAVDTAFKGLGYVVVQAFEHAADLLDTTSPRELHFDLAESAADLPASLVELREQSLSTAQAASRLGVDPSRIRQRLGERSLYGFKDGTGWWLPEVQFDGDHIVPGVDQVFPEIERSVSPVAIVRWFVLPWADLVVDEECEIVVSPRAWLLEGREPAPVIAQARVL